METGYLVWHSQMMWFAEGRKKHNRMCWTERCKGLKICGHWKGSWRKKIRKGRNLDGKHKTNRSTEGTKKMSFSWRQSFRSGVLKHMCERSAFWHWEHLGCWQSWSHLFPSQNSNFAFWAFLIMIKKPPIRGLGFWHCFGAGERMVLPRAGMEPRVGSHQEICATFPWSQGRFLYLWALEWSHSSTELSLWSLVCPSHCWQQFYTHKSVKRN